MTSVHLMQCIYTNSQFVHLTTVEKTRRRMSSLYNHDPLWVMNELQISFFSFKRLLDFTESFCVRVDV